MITAFHGLRAYRGAKTGFAAVQAAARVQAMGEGQELCAADRPIGPVGLTVYGPARQVFECDVWSYIEAGGRRECRDHMPVGEYPTDDEWRALAFSVYQAKAASADEPDWNGSLRYSEAWVAEPTVIGVWVKAWAPHDLQIAARVIARRHGVTVQIVTGADRIWAAAEREVLAQEG